MAWCDMVTWFLGWEVAFVEQHGAWEGCELNTRSLQCMHALSLEMELKTDALAPNSVGTISAAGSRQTTFHQA